MTPAPIYHPQKSLWTVAEELRPSLAGAVEAALWTYAPLRASGVEIETEAANGQVTLVGFVRSSTQKAMASRLAASVPGVEQVENRLIADSELEVGVAEALAGDRELAGTVRRAVVKSLAGRVILHLDDRDAGPDPQALSERMAWVAGSVPGVRSAGVRLSTPALGAAGPIVAEAEPAAPPAAADVPAPDARPAPAPPPDAPPV